MKIRPLNRASIVALVSASTFVAYAGCASTKPSSKVQPASATTDPPKKEYQWKDMSTGKSFFKPLTPATQN